MNPTDVLGGLLAGGVGGIASGFFCQFGQPV
jgi:membrane-associated phospholipid phosphatase